MNEREDYLDRLLRGVEDSPEDSKEDDGLFDFGSTAEDDDFLKAFEKSLSGSPETPDPDSDMGFNLDEIDNIVSNAKDKAGEDGQEFMVNTMGGEDSYGASDADGGLDSLLSGLGGDDSLDSFDLGDEVGDGFGDAEAEEPDADGFGLGEEDSPKDELDSMAAELAREMDELDLGGEEDEDFPEYSGEDSAAGSGKKAKKAKKASKEKGEKKGFFQRLAIALFGEDDEEEEEFEGTVPEIGDIDNISDENLDILKELEQKEEPGESEKDRKKREKAEKKAQKAKEKAEKKAQKAKEKQAKPKKEKKPKEPKVVEKSKPLPKMPVILITLVGVSLVVLIYLGASQVGYTTSVAEAKEYYDEGDYISAYDSLGRNSKIRKADEDLYNRARIVSYLHQQVANYKSFQRYGLYVEALNSLVCGVGRYDINAAAAAEAGAEAEYEEMLTQIEKALKENYNMGLEEARELYNIRDKEEYTYTVYEVIDNLGLIR